MRALISVSDKTGIIELAGELVQLKFDIVSTGGTAKVLKEAGIAATEVSELTQFAEILGGRVKTLHPKIFGGILFDRDNSKHKSEIEHYDIPLIDWVIVNLYPFEKINLENRISKSEMLEFIDIGGVSLLRAAGKNFKDVVALCDQNDYQKVLQEVKENKTVSLETKKMLAAKAFAHTAHYDSMIARFFRENGKEMADGGRQATEPQQMEQHLFPEELTIGLRKIQNLRYGENPQQMAALYKESGERDWGVVNAKKLQGKELSFNNYLDMESAWQIVNSFGSFHPHLNPLPLRERMLLQPSPIAGEGMGEGRVCCAIIKHTNPCGVAIGKNPLESFQIAFNADPLSAFGGVIGFSSTVDRETAEEITKTFFECVIAPDFSPDALEIFKTKPNLRLLEQKTIFSLPYELDIKKISGGILVQQMDWEPPSSSPSPLKGEGIFPASLVGEGGGEGKIGGWKTVTKRAPTPEEIYSLAFTWKVSKFVKSNAIVLARGTVTSGIGSGQTSRIDSLKVAIQKMKVTSSQTLVTSNQSLVTSSLPLVMASDGFFPFRDCVDQSAKIGVSAIIQPGGSIRDQESVEAANEHNIAMLFTGVRHFRH